MPFGEVTVIKGKRGVNGSEFDPRRLSPAPSSRSSSASRRRRSCDHILLHGPGLSADFEALTRRYGIHVRLPQLPGKPSAAVAAAGKGRDSKGSSNRNSGGSSNRKAKATADTPTSGAADHEAPVKVVAMALRGSSLMPSTTSSDVSGGTAEKKKEEEEGKEEEPKCDGKHGCVGNYRPTNPPLELWGISNLRNAATWLEVLTGPVVDLVYDMNGIERTNVLFQKVCPALTVADFNDTVRKLVRELWWEDLEMYQELTEKSGKNYQ